MISVTYNGQSYECTTALKGTDYIHLLDASGNMITAFDGVTDFTGFSITGGSWTTPKDVSQCYLAVIGDDGVIRKGRHKDFETAPRISNITLLAASWVGSDSPYTQTITLAGTTVNSKVDVQMDATALGILVDSSTTALWVENSNGTLTAKALGEKPNADLSIQVTISEVST